MIYFIQDSGSLAIKIGYTSSDEPEARLKACQTGNPSELVLLATMPGDRDVEAVLHQRFAPHRLAGEWFRPVPGLLKTVVACSGRQAVDDHVKALSLLRDLQGKKAPPKWPLTIYLAGKISADDWRQGIVEKGHCQECANLDSCRHYNRYYVQLRQLEECAHTADLMRFEPWPINYKAIFGEHHYSGPYFISCEICDCNHVGCDCYQGDDSHMVGAQHPSDMGHGQKEHVRRGDVHRECARAIERSDLIFAWIDAHDCYGTVAEIGYAAALGKRIWIAGPRYYRDMWFVYEYCLEFKIRPHHTPRFVLEEWLDEEKAVLERMGLVEARP